jgi:hypothetical protein
MTVAFDPHNLDAAVTAVIEEAARQEQASLFDKQVRGVDLTDRQQVRNYLKDEVRAAYGRASASPGGMQIARIEGVPYRGIGFVFELHGDVNMYPAPEGVKEGEHVDHLALFWANLSR